MNATEKLNALRTLLAQKKLDGFILPVADEYLSEYVPAHAARLPWLTGFTGSAGTAVVLADKAALFTDGRYTIQAEQEVDGALYERHNIADLTPDQWLKRNIAPNASIGFDPRLHSAHAAEHYKTTLAERNAELVSVVPNPIDALWQDRPQAPSAPAFVHALEYAGEDIASKITRAADALAAKKADAAVLTIPESINWLLNIRGGDVEFTPVLQAYAILFADAHVVLYAPAAKIPSEVKTHFGKQVEVRPPEALAHDIQELGWQKKRLLVDPAESPYWFAQLASEAGASLVAAPDPCLLLKACKSETELTGIRRAHIEDGAAIARFLHWLDTEIEAGRVVDELSAAEKLLSFRAQNAQFISPSFATIAGSGPNGAIVHYRASEASNRRLQQGELFLLDSGGQYFTGTTDITRTIAIGTPSPEQKDRFTRVLKGHIALAMTRFPEGTTGSQLDALARQFLWQAELDYDHGTGHGVGYALSVHEGPQRISKRASDIALKPGMVLSNEPGYYKAGEYGIRIENLVAVTEAGKGEGGRRFLSFDTLTCAPIDTRLITPALMSADEKEWLNYYHQWVEQSLIGYMDEQESEWLQGACAKLS